MDCGHSYSCLSAPGSYLGACIFGLHDFVRLRCCSARKAGRACALVFIPNSRCLLLNARTGDGATTASPVALREAAENATFTLSEAACGRLEPRATRRCGRGRGVRIRYTAA